MKSENQKMQIAILGAGFCGLATAWHLTQRGYHNIVIFDPLDIGKGTSGMAAGLLHPFAGVHAKKNPQADEGMAASLNLIDIAEKALKAPIVHKKGLIRLAITAEQQIDFAATASRHSDVHWLTVEASQKKLGFEQPYPGIYINSARVVDCPKYLEGLWIACKNEGVIFEKRAIQSLEEVSHFDRIIVTMGAATKKIPKLQDLKITPIKGQLLEMKWPESVPVPSYPISSQTYLIMKEGENKCIAGATFERNFNTENPEIEVALQEILPKMHPFLPELIPPLTLECHSGMRASTPSHQPILEKINEKTWLLTGMGSKGLLYHALYAERLALSL